MNEIKIYSRNIFGIPFFAGRHEARINRMADQIKLVCADIVLLQEVFLSKDKRQLERRLGENFDIYQAKNGFFKLGGGLCGFFKKDIKIENKYLAFHSSGFLSDLTITDKIAEKGFQAFKIYSPFELMVINTHLTCPYKKDIDSDKKMKKLLQDQLLSITEYLKEESEVPMVLCGDFNIEPGQDIMIDFISENRLEDRFAYLDTTMLGNYYSPQWLFQRKCNAKKPDYIFTRKIPDDWKIFLQVASDDGVISDHVGIITTIKF